MMLKKFRIVLCTMAALLGGCATTIPKESTAPLPVQEKDSVPSGPDLDALERTLQMDRAKSELGFEEKAFDPCELGLAKPPSCGKNYFIVLNFQLHCRDTAGTVENYEVEPIQADQLKWAIGKISSGTTATDHEGYGKVHLIAPVSAAKQKLRLTHKNDFLIVNASELRRVVTPPEWCRRN